MFGALAVTPATAQAATTIGDPLTATVYDFASQSYTLVPVRNPDTTVYAGSPVAGVITSVSARVGGPESSVEALFLRPTSDLGEFAYMKKIAANVTIPVTADDDSHIATVTARVSIEPGDRVGLSVPPWVKAFAAYVGTGTDLCAFHMSADGLAVGSIGSYAVNSCYGYWPAVQATVEADADGDGFGDETQDLCPGDPATQLPCGTSGLPGVPDSPGSTVPANIAVKAVVAKAKAGARATRSFRITNTGGRPSPSFKLAFKTSKPARSLKVLGGCKPDRKQRGCTVAALAAGASTTVRVRVVGKKAKKLKLTATATVPGDAIATDNKASTTVKFKLKK